MVTVMRQLPLIVVGALTASARAQVPWSIVPGNPGEGFGFAVCSAGDIDHDGVLDWAAGAPSLNTTGLPGHAEIHSGRTGALLRTYTGSIPSGFFGRSIADVGDVDADGWDDLAIGATDIVSLSPPPGYVRVHSGRDGSVLYTIQSTVGHEEFGFAVAGVGDVNGDGRPDFAVGSRGDPLTPSFAGQVFVYSGLDGSSLHVISETMPGAQFGSAILGGRDLDHDGRADFVVGAVGPSSSTGFIRAYSGASGAVLFTKSGTVSGQGFGNSLAFIGDVNHDGTEDLLVGSQGGLCAIVSGADGSFLLTIPGSAAAGFGYAVCTPGDLDGDGVPDIVSSSPYSNVQGFYSGQLDFYAGQGGTLLTTIALPGPAQSFLGFALAAIGDVNGDGVGDVLAGVPGQSAVRVIAGGCPPPHAYCAAKTNSHGCVPQIGWSGTASLSSSGLVVSATNVLSHAPGMLFWGTMPASIPFNGGMLCITGSPIVRTPIHSSGGASPASDCSGRYAFTFTPAYMASKGLVSGSRVYAQFYSRDAGFPAPQNVGLTDALEFIVCP